MIRVIISDDHPIIREGIRSSLADASDIQVVGQAENGEETLRLVKELQPDILIMDVVMPGINGLEVMRSIKEEGLAVKVLILSAYDDASYVKSVLVDGASGYIVKDEALEYIKEAIRGVYKGEEGWLSRKATVQMLSGKPPQTTDFTQREWIILRGIVEGKTEKSIAAGFGIKEKTLWKYLNRLYKKMGVISKVEAAVIAAREGWFNK